MTDKTIVHVPGLSDGLIALKVPISSVIKANGFIFLSGMPPMDVVTGKIVGGDIAQQTKTCLDAIQHALTAAGSSLDKVVNVRIYCSNASSFSAINEVYKTYFPKDPPTRTFIPVSSWEMGFDVELECVALA